MAGIVENFLGGELRFTRGWQNQHGFVIELEAGGYAMVSGHPVNKETWKKVIEVPEDRQKALEWFENKDKQVLPATRYIQQMRDGSYRWDDGGMILDWGEILNYYAGQIPQDIALWWAKEVQRREKLSGQEARDIASAAKKIQQGRGSANLSAEGEQVITE